MFFYSFSYSSIHGYILLPYFLVSGHLNLLYLFLFSPLSYYFYSVLFPPYLFHLLLAFLFLLLLHLPSLLSLTVHLASAGRVWARAALCDSLDDCLGVPGLESNYLSATGQVMRAVAYLLKTDD